MVYRYDGSFDGFWSCVFMSFRNRETPEQVLAPDELPLASGVWVGTRKDWAGRVRKGIRARFGEEVWDYLRDGRGSCCGWFSGSTGRGKRRWLTAATRTPPPFGRRF